MNHRSRRKNRKKSQENYPKRSGGRSGSNSAQKNMEEQQYHQQYFDTNSPPRRAQSVDSKTVAMGGIVTLVATNFKAEIRLIIEKLFALLGG